MKQFVTYAVAFGLAVSVLMPMSVVTAQAASKSPSQVTGESKAGSVYKRRATDTCKAKGLKKGSPQFSECMRLQGIDS